AVSRAKNILEGKGSETENQTICMNAGLVHSLVTENDNLKVSAAECMKVLQSGKPMETLKKWATYHNASGSVVSGGPGL
ncbi:MAG: hypothetical protein OEZ34_12575, partial [Spirochaetia bacterium]|nr:hypothetical protein [Spirochaetia bacterium]